MPRKNLSFEYPEHYVLGVRRETIDGEGEQVFVPLLPEHVTVADTVTGWKFTFEGRELISAAEDEVYADNRALHRKRVHSAETLREALIAWKNRPYIYSNGAIKSDKELDEILSRFGAV